MTQITFTSNVKEVSTDSNLDNSIRWFVYEKPSLVSPGNNGIYLRRQVDSSNLESERQIVNIGTNPKIYFLVNEWILLFNFKNRLAQISFEENSSPTLTFIPFNQVGNAGQVLSLVGSGNISRIVFQANSSSSGSLQSFARMPAVGNASVTSELTSFAEAPPAFMGTNGVPGLASLSGFVLNFLVKLRIKESASGSATLLGRVNVFFGTTVITTNASLEGVVFLGGTSVILPKTIITAEASSSSNLSSSLLI